MRKILVIVAAALSLQSASAFAASGDTMNFRFSPLGLVFGLLSVSMDFKVSEDWTVGPRGSYWRLKYDGILSEVEVTAYGFGGRANWFKNGVFTDGLYLGPSIEYASAKATVTDSAGGSSATASLLFAQAIVGYGWFWDSFNIMLGGGLSLPLGDADLETTENGVKTKRSVSSGNFAAEFSLGWTF